MISKIHCRYEGRSFVVSSDVMDALMLSVLSFSKDGSLANSASRRIIVSELRSRYEMVLQRAYIKKSWTQKRRAHLFRFVRRRLVMGTNLSVALSGIGSLR
jgi:hypothetical protein